MKNKIIPLLAFFLGCSLALYNINYFPKMVGDEGIYVAQAYWLTHFGQLGPYTYWYDHFPLGWLQIGAWQTLIGVSTFFNSTVLSARVFMGLILGITTTFVYLIANRLTRSKLTSLIATIAYITSSLTLTFGRMVLLDNLAIFWFLLSFYILILSPSKLKNISLSALFISLSILTKESLLFFLPPYLFLVYYLNKANLNRKYTFLVSNTTIFFLLCFFPLLALLKGEFLPSPNRVSFLGTVLFQSSRGSGLPFWQTGSHFREMLSVWLSIDPIFIMLGSISTLFLTFFAKNFSFKIISIFTLFFTLFLARGGQIFDFYLIPLIPLFAINIGLLIDQLTETFSANTLKTIFIAGLGIYFFSYALYPLTAKGALSQTDSISAALNLPKSSYVVANNYLYLDAYLNGNIMSDWYQKIESDPKVRANLSKSTHFLIDEQFSRELESGELPSLKSHLSSYTLLGKYGHKLSPGEKSKPYASEYIELYGETSSSKIQYLVTFPKNAETKLKLLAEKQPYGVLITRDNFSDSTGLEQLINQLHDTFARSVKIIVVQDDTGESTIPWVVSPSRSFYKSGNEAGQATSKKLDGLANAHLDGAIISSTSDYDGFLDSIASISSPVEGIYRYDGQAIPKEPLTILVTKPEDAQKITAQKYNGRILETISLDEYLKN